LKYLAERARLNFVIREFFREEGFLEIEAPLVVPSPGLELHLDAFAVADASPIRYLITSPEYQMKRLLGRGASKIYSLGKVFRRGEVGRHHNPEFTMLEWYRAHAGWEAIADDVERLVRRAAREFSRPELDRSWERMTVGRAMEKWAGVRVDGDESADELRARGRAAGRQVPAEGDFSDVFFTLFLDGVEPALGKERPIVLHDWPAPLCALARQKPGDPRVVERFEVYAQVGDVTVELCNGFGELIDPVEQRRRFEADLAERRRRGLPEYPIDERFLEELARMPPSGGVALGVDRLAMVLFGAREIREVLPFAWDEL
jgi:lysyl-tRNA synthetase class 2